MSAALCPKGALDKLILGLRRDSHDTCLDSPRKRLQCSSFSLDRSVKSSTTDSSSRRDTAARTASPQELDGNRLSAFSDFEVVELVRGWQGGRWAEGQRWTPADVWEARECGAGAAVLLGRSGSKRDGISTYPRSQHCFATVLPPWTTRASPSHHRLRHLHPPLPHLLDFAFVSIREAPRSRRCRALHSAASSRCDTVARSRLETSSARRGQPARRRRRRGTAARREEGCSAQA